MSEWTKGNMAVRCNGVHITRIGEGEARDVASCVETLNSIQTYRLGLVMQAINPNPQQEERREPEPQLQS